jgi:hypothetical protein
MCFVDVPRKTYRIVTIQFICMCMCFSMVATTVFLDPPRRARDQEQREARAWAREMRVVVGSGLRESRFLGKKAARDLTGFYGKGMQRTCSLAPCIALRPFVRIIGTSKCINASISITSASGVAYKDTKRGRSHQRIPKL